MASLAASIANLVSTLSPRLPGYNANQNRELTLPHEGNLVHFKGVLDNACFISEPFKAKRFLYVPHALALR